LDPIRNRTFGVWAISRQITLARSSPQLALTASIEKGQIEAAGGALAWGFHGAGDRRSMDIALAMILPRW
jgi:hypothetical protein